MHWIAPSEKDTDNAALEKRLWDAADQFRANSGLKSQEYSAPVLGLIFLRFAEVRFAAQRAKLEKAGASSRRGSRVDEPAAYHAEGVLYLPTEARFDYLLNRPEAENIGAKVNAAVRDIEKHNPQRIAGILSAYDELMENGQRRIRLLEAMARALYREWFVHFRCYVVEVPQSHTAHRHGNEPKSSTISSNILNQMNSFSLAPQFWTGP
jgi:type I restriction-modification system DNA methylase subunit